MKLFSKFVLIGLLVATTVSCSDYNELLKSDNYEKKITAADENFKTGQEPKVKYRKNPKKIAKKGKIRKVKYRDVYLNRAVALYEQIYQRMPKSAEGELAYFRIGKAYYLAEDYYMAGYYLGMFPQRFPYSSKGEEATFLSAMCSVNNSPAPSLDQTDTELAIRDLQSFIDRYPQSNLIDSCNQMIDELRFKLEKKAYNGVTLYNKTERWQAAVSAGETFIEDYPLSQYREEVTKIIVHNSYLLAINSVENKKEERIDETIERYNNFVSQFPESTYRKQLENEREELVEMRNEILLTKEEAKKDKKEN